MFNVTIINAKGSIKKIAILIVTLILLFIVTRFIQNLKSKEVACQSRKGKGLHKSGSFSG